MIGATCSYNSGVYQRHKSPGSLSHISTHHDDAIAFESLISRMPLLQVTSTFHSPEGLYQRQSSGYIWATYDTWILCWIVLNTMQHRQSQAAKFQNEIHHPVNFLLYQVQTANMAGVFPTLLGTSSFTYLHDLKHHVCSPKISCREAPMLLVVFVGGPSYIRSKRQKCVFSSYKLIWCVFYQAGIHWYVSNARMK